MGIALTKLVVISTATGLYGRVLITLGRNSGPKNAQGEVDLPSHKFGPGSIVCIVPEGLETRPNSISDIDESTLRGVTFKTSASRIQIALDTPPDIDLTDSLFSLLLMTNDVTYAFNHGP